MKQVRVIKTDQDYEEAIKRLSSLMDEEITPGSAKEAELELLALVIESFERSRIETVNPSPIDAIVFRMDQMGLQKKDLVPYLGSLSKVSEVLSGKRPLSLSMIRKVHKGLGIPAEILLAETHTTVDLEAEPEYDYSKFPWQEMLERGYLKRGINSVREAKDRGEELFQDFMQNMSTDKQHPVMLRAPLHQSGSRVMDEHALLVWRIAVLKKAQKQQHSLKVKYQPGAITSAWLRDLTKLSAFEAGPLLAVEYLANAGIVLVIEEHFKKTYLDGAAMLNGSTPIVALTLRHDRVDHFWFALLHELVHVQKHLTANHAFIADNLEDKTRVSKEESEADLGAQQALIPQAEWENSEVRHAPNRTRAIELAKKLRVHPAIVAGRVQHEQKNFRLLTGLNEGVRHHFKLKAN